MRWLGVEPDTLLAKAGLRDVHLRGETRAPRDRFLAAKVQLAVALDDPCVGYRLGRTTELDDFGAFGALLQHAPSLSEAVAAGTTFLPAWEEGVEVQLERARGHVTLVYRNLGVAREADAVDGAHTVVFFAQLARLRLGRGAWIGVTCKGPPPRHRACGEAIEQLADEVRYRSARWSIRLDEASFARLDPRPHPEVERLVRSALDAQLATLGPRPLALETVAAHIRTGLARGGSLADVAGQLGVAPRTLQKWLAAQGTTWSRVLREVRLGRVEVLRAEGATLASIAPLVGLGSASALSRLLRRSPRAR
jgi:AraC-like DNA-binding protein